MATVWSATNVFTERHFAIKFLNPAVAKTPEAAQRFMKEARVSARINHPNVIDILDVGQTDDQCLFLVMELLTGVPLEVALRRQQPTMSLHEFTFVMVEVARALGAAHRAGVIHRDLKPSNIFLHKDKSGSVVPKLLDFGVSKFLEDDQNHALTIAGTVLGSPLYMSPEQARGDHNLDGRTDVFAFGAIMFEALTGYRPFDGANFNQLIVTIATKQPKSVDECAPEMPESLRGIVRACLETDRDKRLGSFDTVAEMLYNALPELESSPLRLPAPQARSLRPDPDATNALPIVRASDKPPPAASPPGSAPPGAQQQPQFSSQWPTPNPSYASITFTHKPKNGVPILIAAALLVVVVGAAIGVTLSIRFRPDGKDARAAAASAKTTLTMSQTSSTKPSAEPAPPPLVSIDALPIANQQLGPIAKGNGRLVVGAAPGWCNITIDKTPKGPTPLSSVDLPAGQHQLKCEPPQGAGARIRAAKTATVTLAEGQTSKFTFNLDD
jgi:serine/threonine-protein kinase